MDRPSQSRTCPSTWRRSCSRLRATTSSRSSSWRPNTRNHLKTRVYRVQTDLWQFGWFTTDASESRGWNVGHCQSMELDVTNGRVYPDTLWPVRARLYPPYINYLDNAQKMIKELEGSNQRFNAFCRARLAKGSYNRQSLSALLSLPFQQLPRYILLLDSLLKSIKKFNEHHDDIPNLQNAIAGIKKVTATVNDKKQQADDHLAMFDIFSQIKNALNQIISAQRHYQFRFNCTAVDS